MTKLFDLIMQGQALVDAIASSPEYALLRDNEHLSDLDVELGDIQLFLMQLDKALGEATEAQAGSGLPSFEQLFDESALTNSLSLLPQPTVSEVTFNFEKRNQS